MISISSENSKSHDKNPENTTKNMYVYILWQASTIVNKITDTVPNKNIALFVALVVAIAATNTIIILLFSSHQIDCILLSTDRLQTCSKL